MLDLHRLRLLLELQRRGTIAEVARVLSFSASAVSQQLSVLEREAGTPLLEKAGRGVRLTSDAEILVRHTEAVIAQLEQAEAELAAASGQLRGTFRVVCFASVILALMPTVLSRLADQHPLMDIEIADSTQPENASALLAGEIDLAITDEFPNIPNMPIRGVHVEPLLDDEMLVAIPSSMTIDGPVLPSLRNSAWVLEVERRPVGQWSRNLFREAGIEPHVPFTSGDLLLQIELVRRGLAVAFLPGLHASRGITGISLLSLPSKPRRRISTAVRSGAADHPRVLAFRAALRETANAEPELYRLATRADE